FIASPPPRAYVVSAFTRTMGAEPLRRQDDFSDVSPRLHEPMRIRRLLERKRARDDGVQPAGADFLQQQRHRVAELTPLVPQMPDVQAEDAAVPVPQR